MNIRDILRDSLRDEEALRLVGTLEDGEVVYWGFFKENSHGETIITFREFPDDAVIIPTDTIDELDLHMNAFIWLQNRTARGVPSPMPRAKGTKAVRFHSILEER